MISAIVCVCACVCVCVCVCVCLCMCVCGCVYGRMISNNNVCGLNKNSIKTHSAQISTSHGEHYIYIYIYYIYTYIYIYLYTYIYHNGFRASDVHGHTHVQFMGLLKCNICHKTIKVMTRRGYCT